MNAPDDRPGYESKRFPAPTPETRDEELGSVRRWTWVALAWALAASVIALIALFSGSPEISTGKSGENAALQRVGQLSDDLAGVTKRVEAIEESAGDPVDAGSVETLSKQVEDLAKSVSDLRSEADQQVSENDSFRQAIEALDGRVAELEAAADSQE